MIAMSFVLIAEINVGLFCNHSRVTKRVTVCPLAASSAVYPTSGAFVKPAAEALAEGTSSPAWKLIHAIFAARDELTVINRTVDRYRSGLVFIRSYGLMG